MSADHPNFDFKNWDFLDPKIVARFKTISDVSQMLADHQDKLKNADFVSFKDKKRVQSNINRFKSSLQELVQSQKENLINYFDKQLDFVSKKAGASRLSRTFQNSLRLQRPSWISNSDNKASRKERRYSEGDLSRYLKEQDAKEQVLSEVKKQTLGNESFRGAPTSGRTTLRTILGENSEASNSERGSWLHVNDLEAKDPLKAKDQGDRKGSIFSRWGEDKDAPNEPELLENKVRELQGELTRKEHIILPLRRYYQLHRRRALANGLRRREKVRGRDFVKDRKTRRRHIEQKSIKNEVREVELEAENRRLRERLEAANKKNEMIVRQLKDLSEIVLDNDQMIEEMKQNNEDVEEELKRTKELNSSLVKNFSQFKGYVQNTMEGVSNKLAMYVQKEEIYNEIAQENEELKQRCKSLLYKLKQVTHS